MSKPSSNSTLYLLIETGQLAHRTLSLPLLERGLEPGDDALLFVIADRKGAMDAELAKQMGISTEVLQPRLERLVERDMLVRQAVGPDLQPGVALTERGERMRSFLLENWNNLEDALFGELKKKKRKGMKKMLRRLSDLLRL